MIRANFIIVSILIFTASIFAQEYDILDFATKHPGGWLAQNPDGTYRTPKYGDKELEQSVEQLKAYSQPFTVPKVITSYRQAKDAKIKTKLLRVLAASRDSRAAVILGNSLNNENPYISFSAVNGLMDYFILTVVCCGNEGSIIFAHEWWEKNRGRLEKEAVCISSNIKPDIPLQTVQDKCVENNTF